MSIPTLVTAYYVLNAKVNSNQYLNWAHNLLSNINSQFNVILFTNKQTFPLLAPWTNNPNIRIVIKEFETFHTYPLCDLWISNHNRNIYLNTLTEWTLHMLWCEKINFVKMAASLQPENNTLIWCDIGYFREGFRPIHWPASPIINSLNTDTIYYGLVCNNLEFDVMKKWVLDGKEISPKQNSISGGFFIIHRDMVNWWWTIFYNKLNLYLSTGKLVKDDQIILVDCIANHYNKFTLLHNPIIGRDIWFQFQRFLSLSIDIIMPIKNGIEFISDSVNSVINQTYPNWTLHLCVNGLPSASNEFIIAQNYRQKDPRIKVVEWPNINSKVDALNEAISTVCTSLWICVLDVDDIWQPTKLEMQLPYTDKYDVIGTNCRYFGKRTGVPTIPLGCLKTFNFMEYNPIINSSCLLKRNLAIWQHFVGIEDYALWLVLWKQGRSFYNVPDILVSHRIHDNSAFNTKDYTQDIIALKHIINNLSNQKST